MSLQAHRPPHRDRHAQAWAVCRGLLAVAGLLLTALDALITARVGWPPLSYLGRRWGREIADEFRRGYHGAVDAEILDEGEL